METLALADVAKILHKSLSTCYTDLFRNPHRLPPRLRLPGNRKVLFLRADVEAWLSASTPEPRKRRGRPTVAEQIRRGSRK